ncbi:hypothetical protein CEXT_381301 [Caerostris extrusa]|uniref:Uncharacterized protein n=1 Tax=Caerostris extrusa TaxID=172846 RepID=A0AAV4URH6_CAEEX|nr:hypothetical protein CEXT_381301 [Caerostris extrusa]
MDPVCPTLAADPESCDENKICCNTKDCKNGEVCCLKYLACEAVCMKPTKGGTTRAYVADPKKCPILDVYNNRTRPNREKRGLVENNV